MGNQCKYCQGSFMVTRKNRDYCTKQCSNRYRYELQRYEDEIALKRSKLKSLEAELVEYRQGAKLYHSSKNAFEKEDQRLLQLGQHHQFISGLNDQELLNKIVQTQLEKHELHSPEWRKVDYHYGSKSTEGLKSLVSNYRKNVLKELEHEELKNAFVHLKYIGSEKKIKAYQDGIESLKKQIVTPFFPKNPTTPTRKVPKPFSPELRAAKSDNEPLMNERSYGGQEIRDMEFDVVHLKGELGRFLGAIDFNGLAIVLTGDAAAGKSYFSFHLAKLFLDHSYSVKYYAMEESLSQPLKTKLIEYNIGDEISVLPKAKLYHVKQDAPNYDVLIIDSFSKLGAKAEDFDHLRQMYPKTAFICIFQKTTSGSPRGGASIVFDATAVIDITKKNDKRIATMKKSRYGTQGWVYSIDDDQIMVKS